MNTLTYPLDEKRRSILRKTMTSPEWKGLERGVYEVTLSLKGSSRVEIFLQEAVLIRQIDRLLQRVVDQNRRALVGMVQSEEPRHLLERAWAVLEPVRSVASCDGEYKMTFPGDVVVSFTITEWDSALLQRYDDLLSKVYEANKSVVDGWVKASSSRGSSGVSSCSTSSPKARRPGEGEVSEAA